jgi:hypothetical protein
LPKDDVHAEQNQQRGGAEGKIGRDLEKMKVGVLGVLPSDSELIRRDINHFKNDRQLGVVTNQRAMVRRQALDMAHT